MCDDIFKFIKIYEREPEKVDFETIKKYKGLKNILFPDEKVTLYRGIFLTNDLDSIDYHPIEDVQDNVFDVEKNNSYRNFNNYSWTKSYKVAEKFARGSKTWMDEPKEFRGEQYGVVLEYTPEPGEIFIDFKYLEDEYKKEMSFPEDEVILCPDKTKFKIKKVLK